jgi:Na+/H+ antiporter NhaC
MRGVPPNTQHHPGRHIVPIVIFLILLATAVFSSSARSEQARVQNALEGIPFLYVPPTVIMERAASDSSLVEVQLDGKRVFIAAGKEFPEEGITLTVSSTGRHIITVSHEGVVHTQQVRVLHGFLSILPPIVAIVFALIFKQVVVALLAGVWLGAFFLSGYRPIIALLRIVDHFCIETLAGSDGGSDHTSIIIFTLLLGGMVGITSRMGGMKGIVNSVSRIATSARRGQFAVWLMGVIIFFDDYTNTLIVGNSTRPLTDRLRISREKLSYIVDSTAAPITSLAVITSWIGFQISLINQSFISLGIDRNPLTTFVASLPYSFYPILAVLFVLIIIVLGRDYSMMLKAEQRARLTGKVLSDSAVPISNIDAESVDIATGASPRFFNGVIPIAVVVIVSFIGLVLTGRQTLVEAGVRNAGLLEALKESNSFAALLWGSFSGCIAAALLSLTQGLLSLTETVTAWMNGIRSMITAIIILVLAWCIGKVCTDLQTADYLVHHLAGVLSPRFLPLVVFLLSMGISFSTGTSWGTMSILTPIVIPLVLGTTRAAGLPAAAVEQILLGSIAAILSGAVFGDHCSPISDTTIMSSMASAADHIDHVRTQLPYAVTVGVVSLVSGYLLKASGVPVWACLAVSCAVLVSIVRFFGRSVEVP